MGREWEEDMKFTKTEWEIINDRLGISDCIWDALTDFEDSADCLIKETWEELYKRCNELLALTPKDEVDMDDNLTAHIIWDCCDGSTFFFEMPDNMRARYTKAAYSLQRKLDVYIPLD